MSFGGGLVDGGEGGIPVAREGELYSLKWHTFQAHLTAGLKGFLFDGDFLTDVTLVAEGQAIRSHRMLLSLCSPHFKQLFQASTFTFHLSITNYSFKSKVNMYECEFGY